jgi:hypothetical protein
MSCSKCQSSAEINSPYCKQCNMTEQKIWEDIPTLYNSSPSFVCTVCNKTRHDCTVGKVFITLKKCSSCCSKKSLAPILEIRYNHHPNLHTQLSAISSMPVLEYEDCPLITTAEIKPKIILEEDSA